ncbi:T9SS type A sorting domain-containing protein [Winogradskyella bathintestinalis]|uniref:T9SS type A sorting domain-containing protein n=1 Tax=Winogradskyella bathintestinalis TaxID=3035208 RepID=A0ABT7ZW67_9FLAO|nr:T9SS type A sorting domain-containing protein [Winogradskyella bathintestinalis]MDN3493074.1 T9SS type A sorting domain-containing protein [Winogradskyella bathintestinalis]
MKKFYFTALAVAFCYTTIAQDLSSTVHISAGTTVIVSSGTEVSASEINLKSTSDRFACLFLNDELDPTTVVNYDRYVNKIGSSSQGVGNDLISLPVKTSADATFSEFLTYTDGTNINSLIIPNAPSVPTIFAFGPYNNSNRSYTNYNAMTDGGVILKRGVGYRAASYNGQTVRFTGTATIASETVEISTNNNSWNSVGNPYTTYIDSQAFLSANSEVLDPSAQAIYAYNSGTNTDTGAGTFGNFTIINALTNTDVNIAPGQGFLVANDPIDSTNQLSFTTAMRIYEGTDDFILGRNANQNQMLRLKVENGTDKFATEIYFNANSSQGLDPGYDAALYGDNNLMVYSHLVENNLGKNMAIQSLGLNDLNDISIPLGLKAAQGQEIIFSIEANTLINEFDVYIEDTKANTFTLLNTNSYSFTANNAISGTGRFYLRFEDRALSTTVINTDVLQILASDQTLQINGLLLADTQVSVYDIQGRLVLSSILKEASDSNEIDVASLSQGIYVVKLYNNAQQQTKKVIFK